MKKIGTVTHYYGNIGVAIVELAGKLAKGDRVRFEGGKNEFEQVIDSMQSEHKEIDSAKKGDVIGIKVSDKIGEGAELFLVEE